LAEHLLSTAATYSSVYIMLDALDECTPGTLNKTIHLIRQFKESGVKVFCTFRPTILNNLKEELDISKFHSIEAHDMDIRNYLTIRLNEEWRHNKCFLEQIIERLAEGAKGKSASSYFYLLIKIDFCLSNFSWIIFSAKRNHEMLSRHSAPYRRTCQKHTRGYYPESTKSKREGLPERFYHGYSSLRDL
jgi:hypothetical protein